MTIVIFPKIKPAIVVLNIHVINSNFASLCFYTVKNRRIVVWLHNVDIYQSQISNDGHCLGDYVVILDGTDPSRDESNVLGLICGKLNFRVFQFSFVIT